MDRILLYEHKHMVGYRTTEHRHPFHQLLFVLEGEGEIRLDGEVRALEVNDAALLVPSAVHSVMSDSRLTLLVLDFDAQALEAKLADRLLATHFHTSLIAKPNSFAGSEIRQLLRQMLFEQSAAPSPLGEAALQILLLQLLLTLARSLASPAGGSGSNRLRAEKIRSYIDTHYYEQLTAEDIASRLGMSTRHVNNIFKEKYGLTPMRYLTEVRIQVAQRLLADTDKDVISICFEVGYDSVSTFYRSFKAIVRLSPKAYRDNQFRN